MILASRLMFWACTLIINMLALVFIGVAFLGSSREGQYLAGLAAWLVLIALITAALVTGLGLFCRDVMNFSKKGLWTLFGAQTTLVVLVSMITTLVFYLRT